MCALCSKVVPVKRSCILNVVVKQEILIKTGNKTGDVLSFYMQQSSNFHSLQKYQSHDKTSLYTTLTVWKLVTKKRMFHFARAEFKVLTRYVLTECNCIDTCVALLLLFVRFMFGWLPSTDEIK